MDFLLHFQLQRYKKINFLFYFFVNMSYILLKQNYVNIFFSKLFWFYGREKLLEIVILIQSQFRGLKLILANLGKFLRELSFFFFNYTKDILKDIFINSIKQKNLTISSKVFCDPVRIRTWDLLLRRQLLYPAELWDPLV